jgi:uncharacterized membrane protein HdeD (DUF308 family)
MMIFNIGTMFPTGNKLSRIIKALLFVALGVFLIVTKANAMTMVVQVIAAGLFIVGLVSLLMGMKFTSSIPISSIMNFLISVLLFSFAGPVSTVLRYIIGGILCLFGVSQMLKTLSMRSVFQGNFLPFMVPVFALSLGALFFSEELIGNDIMGLIIGILFILYGVSSLMTTLKVYKLFAKKQPENIDRGPENASAKVNGEWYKVDDQDIKDVDYEKVD